MKNTRLINLRETAEMTQRQLAKEVGLTQSMIALIETGRRAPSWTYRLRLARYFGVTIDWLFFDPTYDRVSLVNANTEERS